MNIHQKQFATSITFYAFFAVWTASCLWIINSNPVISLSDVFGFISRADSLSLNTIDPWVDGLYPLGYPLLLKAFAFFTGDYELAGKWISLISGSISLVIVRLLGGLLFSPVTGTLAVLLCGLNPLFIHYSTNSGTDMVAATSVAGSILCIVAWESSLRRSRLLLALSGALLGLGYLFRYTSIAILPFYILWPFIWSPEPRKNVSSVKDELLYMGTIVVGFLALAMPQLILSLMAKGNPFWNTQGINVCFGALGGGNWGQNFDACRDFKSAFGFIAQHPYDSAKNFIRNIFLIPTIALVPKIVAPFMWSGVLLSLWPDASNQHRYGSRVFLAGSLSLFCAAVSIAFVNDRLLLLPAIILPAYSAYGFLRVVPIEIRAESWKLPFRTLILALIIAVLLRGSFPRVMNPVSGYDAKRILASDAVTKVLGPSGDKQSEVLSLSFDYYDMSSNLKTRYSLDWYGRGGMGKFSSLKKIYSEMKAGGRSYLLFDNSAPFNVVGLADNWPFSEDEIERYFEPAWKHEDAQLLRAR